jgi:hypothetical protein
MSGGSTELTMSGGGGLPAPKRGMSGGGGLPAPERT